MDIPPEGVGIAAAEEVYRDWQGCAQDEEVEQGVVACWRREEAARTDGSPDHACVEMGPGKWAGKAIGAGAGADAGDVVEGPVDDADVAQSTKDHTD